MTIFKISEIARKSPYTEKQILEIIIRQAVFAFHLLDGTIVIPRDECERAFKIDDDAWEKDNK